MRNFTNKMLLLLCLSSGFYSCVENSDEYREALYTGVAAARWDVGKSANFLLSSDIFTAMELELVYMEGFKPSDQMIELMVAFLEKCTLKPDGITVVLKEIPSMNLGEYTTEDIAKIEEDYRERYNEGTTVSVFLLVVDGDYKKSEDNSFTIGAAYRNTSLVLFGNRIAENSGGVIKPRKAILETTVALHEMGHLMGLVNLDNDMVIPHEDEEHESHCDNKDCLMYWAIETSGIFNYMQQSVPKLDDNCELDLKENGGR